MTTTHSTPAIPFPGIIDSALGTVFDQTLHPLVPEETLKGYAFHALETPLVYLMNERRLQGKLAGKTPEEQYLRFAEDIPGALNALQERFPEHWARWVEISAHLSESLRVILRHVTEDMPAISSLLHTDGYPTVKAIKPLGDVHPQGVVCEVVTSAGVVYHKPRPGGNELFLAALDRWMSERAGYRPWLALHFPEVIDRGDHAWVAPVRPEPLPHRDAAIYYYRRAGQLLGLAYLVNLTDLHHENIVATAAQPVPVDVETIMSVLPRTPDGLPDATEAVLKQTASSAASPGLLPLGTTVKELGGDISGFAAGTLRALRRILDRQGRSDMRYVRASLEFTPDTNRPKLSGIPVPAAGYVDDIVEGFTTTLHIALKYRDELAVFIRKRSSNLHVRVLARMTNHYSALLAGLSRVGRTTSPEALFDVLRRTASGLAEPLVASEEAQLRQWAVPHFWTTADSTAIRDPWGKDVGQLRVAPATRTIAKITSLTETDIEYQVSLIRLALQDMEQVALPLHGGLTQLGEGSFENFATCYFDALRAQAVVGRDGSVNWPTLTIDEAGQLLIQPLTGGLYRGVSGVAELLAITCPPGETWHQLAESLLNTLRLEIESSLTETTQAYYHGPASQLAAAGRLSLAFNLAAPWLRPYFEKLLSTLCEADSSRSLDLLEGPAGHIVALRNQPSQHARAVCRRLGHQLLAMTSSGWDSKEAFPWSRNASFAHDSGGVGTALLIAAGLAEDPEMVDGWRGAWEFENTFKLDEGWDDARYPETTYSTNWCHGLAGIALARIVWLQTIHGSAFLERVVSASEIAQIRSELDEASGILMRALHDCGSPSLCHGIAGGAMVLDAAGRLRDRQDWRKVADDLVTRAGATLSRSPRTWGKHDVRDFGIMTGPGGLILARSFIRSPHEGLGPLLPTMGPIPIGGTA